MQADLFICLNLARVNDLENLRVGMKSRFHLNNIQNLIFFISDLIKMLFSAQPILLIVMFVYRIHYSIYRVYIICHANLRRLAKVIESSFTFQDIYCYDQVNTLVCQEPFAVYI